MRLFHLVAPAVWTAAVATGEYRPASLSSEGFVHLSFADQVQGVANALYGDEPQLQAVELEIVDEDVIVEDSYGTGTAFPHLYAVVDPRWTVAVHPLIRVGEEWRFTVGSDREAPDR